MPVEPSERISIIPVVRREDRVLNQKKRQKRQEQKEEKDKKKIDIRI